MTTPPIEPEPKQQVTEGMKLFAIVLSQYVWQQLKQAEHPNPVQQAITEQVSQVFHEALLRVSLGESGNICGEMLTEVSEHWARLMPDKQRILNTLRTEARVSAYDSVMEFRRAAQG